MSEQPSLLDDARGQVRRDHADTSHAAALGRTGTARFKVLAILAAHGEHGLTDEDISNLARISPSTARPRRVELVQAGWVEPAGDTWRSSAWGKRMQVWRITEAGRAELVRARAAA